MSTPVATRPRKVRSGAWIRRHDPIPIPLEAHTLKGFLDWVLAEEFPEKVRVMYLKGEVYQEMTEEEIQTHASPKAEVYRVLLNLNYENDFGDLYADGVLIVNEEADVSNNPDGVAVLWETLDSGRATYGSRREKEFFIRGSPDWVMEILSESSVVKDTRKLRAAYQQAKIPEYWLIDARGEVLKFQILLWRKSGYVAAPGKDGWQRSKVFGRSFRLTRTRNRRGAWKYELQMRED